MSTSRRRFLGAAALAGAGGMLGRFPTVRAAEAVIPAEMVRFRPEIEPLIRLLEDTPRERLLEEVGQRIKGGAVNCCEVTTALLLAGIRNIQPRPVGFKFHAVLVVNSAYLASLNSPDADRWLPVFWALDQFKSSQAQDVKEGDWTMGPVREGSVPPPDQAAALFSSAMDAWDVDGADAAAAGLARGAGEREIFDLFCRYGARDYRDIGHKAIYVANSWRLLQTIGWQHAEPVLRSLAYALLSYDGDNPAKREDLADRPGRRNASRTKDIRDGWEGGLWDAGAVTEMLATLRSGSWDDAAAKAVEILNRKVSPQALWDAMFQYAAEMLVRSPGIVTLHATTTTNALHYAFQNAGSADTRLYLLLQNVSFLPLFREDAGIKDGFRIDSFEPMAASAAPEHAVEEIFAGLKEDRMTAARRTLAYLKGGGDAKAFIDAAQRLVYLKGTDAHDYKFSTAVMEDFRQLSPTIRDSVLAASVYWLKGSSQADSPLVSRSRSVL